MKKITKIEYTKDATGKLNNCTVFYADGSEEITNDVYIKIAEYAIQEGLTLDAVLSNPNVYEKVAVRTNPTQPTPAPSNPTPATPVQTPPAAPTNTTAQPTNTSATPAVAVTNTVQNSGTTQSRKNKKSKKMKFIKITSLCMVPILALAAISYAINKNRSKTYSNSTSKTKITENVKNTPESEITIAPVATRVPTKTEVDEHFNEVFDKKVDQGVEQVDKLTMLVRKIKDKEEISEKEFEYVLNQINRLCYANMAEVEKLIEGGKMSGKETLLNLQNMFAKDSIEYRVLDQFCTMRNSIVHNAFAQDREETRLEVNGYVDFFLDYVFSDSTFELDGKRYGYYDISPVARYMILLLGQTTIETNHEYTGKINNVDCNFIEIIGELEELFNTVTNQLLSVTTLSK